MGEDSEQKHIEKHICNGFDKTDWSVPPAMHDDFTLHSSENHQDNRSAWTIHDEHTRSASFSEPKRYSRKRVKVYGSLSQVSTRRSGKGPRKYMHNSLTPSSEVDQLRSDIKAVIVIGVIAVVLMFILYFSIVISFML